MCIWVKLSSFGAKYYRLLNTPYVKNLIDNNILYVIPKDVHMEAMHNDNFEYTHKGVIDMKYLARNIGRVRSVDINNKMIEIDINPEYEDYIENMNNPRISFLAYTGLNKTGPAFYIHELNEDEEEEGKVV